MAVILADVVNIPPAAITGKPVTTHRRVPCIAVYAH